MILIETLLAGIILRAINIRFLFIRIIASHTIKGRKFFNDPKSQAENDEKEKDFQR